VARDGRDTANTFWLSEQTHAVIITGDTAAAAAAAAASSDVTKFAFAFDDVRTFSAYSKLVDCFKCLFVGREFIGKCLFHECLG